MPLTTTNNGSHFVLIPAAGTGQRMQSKIPKQYLSILGKPILQHTLECFINHPQIEKIVVVLNKNDNYWQNLTIHSHPKIITVTGGEERQQSVLNGLGALENWAEPFNWVLVHDAVRPCLRTEDIDKLITHLVSHPVGGFLGVPVKDTIKQVSLIDKKMLTLNREELWHAYTPQMFRFSLLKEALQHVVKKQVMVTDDAAALELVGLNPMVVQGRYDNIKITQPLDLLLAELYLSHPGN